MSEKKIYLSLDTCVWLELLKIDLHNDDNVFEEICYWIEKGFLIHILPENIQREWDRNKVSKSQTIIKEAKSLDRALLNKFKGNHDLSSVYQTDVIAEIITKRIERVEVIFRSHSEIAKENQNIYNSANDRNLKCLAPNHTKDSYRDSINILTLLNHIKNNNYNNCYFSTINHTDFSADNSKRHELHPQLEEEFNNANLEYVYFDEDPIGSKLINRILRSNLPSFQNHLKEKREKEQEELLVDMKSVPISKDDYPDIDYLENIKHLDIVLLKNSPTVFEQELTKLLIERHDSYKKYFFKNLGNNDLV